MPVWLKKIPYREVGMALVTMIPMTAALWVFGGRWWLLLILVPILLFGFHYRERIRAPWRAALVGTMCAVIIVSGLQDAKNIRANIADPPEWDFLSFWLYGRVAAQGLNFYEAPNYQRQVMPVSTDSDFAKEVIDIGFKYPPPTIFLFVPLGWFDVRTASVLWYVVNGLVLVFDISLLWKTFLKDSGKIGLAFTTALFLLLPQTSSTIVLGQTNFMVLLVLILFWRDHDKRRGGIWLAIGIMVKPFVALLLLYVLVRRQWQILVGAGLTLVLLSLITIGIFGPATFASFFTMSPASQMPGYTYTETINQSLLATILRLTSYDFTGRSPLTQPLFIGIGLVLTAITGWLSYRANATSAKWALALTIPMALMLYPATLEHYGVVLLIVLFLAYADYQEVDTSLWGIWGAVAFVTIEYVILNSRNYVFFAIWLNWLVLAGIVVWMSRDTSIQPKMVLDSTSV